MRIAVITTSFPRVPGDHRSPFIWDQVRFLSDRGLEMSVLAMPMPGAAAHETWQGVRIERPAYLPGGRETLQQDRAGLPGSWDRSLHSRFELLLLLISQWRGCIRLGRNSDLLHAHWTLSGLAALLSRPLHGKPVIVTLHGSDLRLAAQNAMLRGLTRWVLRHADKVIAVSQSLQAQAISLGAPRQKVTVIPDGFDPQQARPGRSAREDAFLYVGSFSVQKGVLNLLDAFERFARQERTTRLYLVGDGPLESTVRERVSAPPLSHRVIVTGSLPHDQVIRLMQRARLLVLPSTGEGFGVVLVEAMACGTPCLGVRSGSMAEVIPPGLGILIEDNQPESILAALKDFAGGRSLAHGDPRRLRKHVIERYDWSVIAEQIHACYREILT